MKRRFILLISGLILVLATFLTYQEIARAIAHRILADPNSSPPQFERALKRFRFPGDPKFWLNIASDSRYSNECRKQCVKHYFDNFVRSGMRFEELLKNIHKNPNWISYGSVTKRGDIAGWVPDVLWSGTSNFIIPILSKPEEDYQLEVMISFDKDLDVGDLVEALQHGANAKTRETVIMGCGTWDSNDQERRYPGSRIRKVYPW